MARTKEQLAEYHKRWREQNKDLLASYKEKNKDRIAAQKREYNVKNRERILTQKRALRGRTSAERSEYNKKWYRENKERKAAKDLVWRAANKEKIAEYSRIYSTERPWISLLSTARKRAKEKGIEYSLSIDWFKSRWTGRCEISGIELAKGNGAQHMRSPTIDRKDSKKGYIPDNCRFVCLALNAMRGDGTDEEMMDLLHATLEFSMSEAICNHSSSSDTRLRRHSELHQRGLPRA